jgi:hypothetical protein
VGGCRYILTTIMLLVRYHSVLGVYHRLWSLGFRHPVCGTH